MMGGYGMGGGYSNSGYAMPSYGGSGSYSNSGYGTNP
jgi:hypothetical protein